MPSDTANSANAVAAMARVGRSERLPRMNSSQPTVAKIKSMTGITSGATRSVIAGPDWLRICGNSVSLAINSTEPPSTTPSSTIRVRSVPRRGRRGKGHQTGGDEEQRQDQEDVADQHRRGGVEDPDGGDPEVGQCAGQRGQAEEEPRTPAAACARPVPATAAGRQGQYGGDQSQPARDLAKAHGQIAGEDQTEHKQADRSDHRRDPGVPVRRAGGVGLGTGVSLHAATLPSRAATIRLHNSRETELGDLGAGVDVRWCGACSQGPRRRRRRRDPRGGQGRSRGGRWLAGDDRGGRPGRQRVGARRMPGRRPPRRDDARHGRSAHRRGSAGGPATPGRFR